MNINNATAAIPPQRPESATETDKSDSVENPRLSCYVCNAQGSLSECLHCGAVICAKHCYGGLCALCVESPLSETDPPGSDALETIERLAKTMLRQGWQAGMADAISILRARRKFSHTQAREIIDILINELELSLEGAK